MKDSLQKAEERYYISKHSKFDQYFEYYYKKELLKGLSEEAAYKKALELIEIDYTNGYKFKD